MILVRAFHIPACSADECCATCRRTGSGRVESDRGEWNETSFRSYSYCNLFMEFPNRCGGTDIFSQFSSFFFICLQVYHFVCRAIPIHNFVSDIYIRFPSDLSFTVVYSYRFVHRFPSRYEISRFCEFGYFSDDSRLSTRYATLRWIQQI